MKNIVLDLARPADARCYVKHFTETHIDASFVDLTNGRRIEFDSMKDEDAVTVAHGLYELETAANNGGVH